MSSALSTQSMTSLTTPLSSSGISSTTGDVSSITACSRPTKAEQLKLPYTIRATKKGTVPCVVEKRKHHKVVVLSNIEGDAKALLSALQKALGTGGVISKKDSNKNSIEIQGEQHLQRVEQFVLKSNCIVGASKTTMAKAPQSTNTNNSAKKSVGGNAHNSIATKNKSEASSKQATAIPTVFDAALDTKSIKSMKPNELKKYLAARQLSIQGNKKELVARLISSIK